MPDCTSLTPVSKGGLPVSEAVCPVSGFMQGGAQQVKPALRSASMLRLRRQGVERPTSSSLAHDPSDTSFLSLYTFACHLPAGTGSPFNDEVQFAVGLIVCLHHLELHLRQQRGVPSLRGNSLVPRTIPALVCDGTPVTHPPNQRSEEIKHASERQIVKLESSLLLRRSSAGERFLNCCGEERSVVRHH